MPYLIETFDKPGTMELRRAVRAEHLDFLDRRKSYFSQTVYGEQLHQIYGSAD
jgi:hypothetical protein